MVRQRRSELADLELQIGDGAVYRLARGERLELRLSQLEPHVDLAGGEAIGLGQVGVRLAEPGAPLPERDLAVRAEEARRSLRHARLEVRGARAGGAHLVLRLGRVDPERVDREPEALTPVAPALLDLLEGPLLRHAPRPELGDAPHVRLHVRQGPRHVGRRVRGEGARQHRLEDLGAPPPRVDPRRRERRGERPRAGRVHVGLGGDEGADGVRDGDEILVHAVRVHRSRLGLLRQETQDQIVERLRDLGVDQARRAWRLLEVLHQEGGDVRRLEGEAPCDHLEEDDADGVEVDAGARLAMADALRGHVLRRPEQLAGSGQARVAARARDPEIEQLHQIRAVLARADEDVLRLQIAVNHLEIVRARDASGDLDHDPHRACDGERPLGDEVRQDAAAQDLHHDVRGVVLRLALVEDLDDVGVAELLRALGLPAKALAHDVVGGERRVQDLDGAGAIDELVARAVDGGHPPLADDVLEHVAAGQQRADPRVGEGDQVNPVDEAELPLVRVAHRALRARLHARPRRMRATRVRARRSRPRRMDRRIFRGSSIASTARSGHFRKSLARTSRLGAPKEHED